LALFAKVATGLGDKVKDLPLGLSVSVMTASILKSFSKISKTVFEKSLEPKKMIDFML